MEGEGWKPLLRQWAVEAVPRWSIVIESSSVSVAVPTVAGSVPSQTRVPAQALGWPGRQGPHTIAERSSARSTSARW
jgi:hypothetical protein